MAMIAETAGAGKAGSGWHTSCVVRAVLNSVRDVASAPGGTGALSRPSVT
jgi:hypothetical protein